MLIISIVLQSLRSGQLFATTWTAERQVFLSITNSWSLLKLMSIESVMSSNHLILHHPLLLPPSIFPSIRVFSNQSVLRIRWPKYWGFSFSISFSIDWCDVLAVQGTLKSFLQHQSSKASNSYIHRLELKIIPLLILSFEPRRLYHVHFSTLRTSKSNCYI